MSTPFPQGGRVFPLPNQIGQITPDIQKNYASIYVEAAQLPKSSGWFSSDSSLGLSFKVVATYLTAGSLPGTTSNSITVTKAYAFDVTRDGDGNVVLPLHSLAIVDTCPLMITGASDKSFLSDLTANLTFLATRASTGFSVALQEIFKLSSKLPIPNPYTQYVSLLGDGISDVVQTIQSQDANPQPLSTIGFQFVGSAASLSGYYVLLMSTDQAIQGGFLDINAVTTSQLGYDPALGLTYNGTACYNAWVVFRVGYTTNPLPLSSTLATSLPPIAPAGAGLQASTSLAGQLLLRQLKSR